MPIWDKGLVEELHPVCRLPLKYARYEPEITQLGTSRYNPPMSHHSMEAKEESPSSFQTPSVEQQLQKRSKEMDAEYGMEKFRYMSYREKGIMEK
jgi:hypothetical protein